MRVIHRVFVKDTLGSKLPKELDSDGVFRLPVGQWLAAAGVSLEEMNSQLPADHRYPGKHPTFRTAGIAVEMQVRFHNTIHSDGALGDRFDALFNPVNIKAEIQPIANRKQWAGLGPLMHYELFPSGASQQRYHKVERYRQGVQFKFVGTGRLLQFNLMEVHACGRALMRRLVSTLASSCARSYLEAAAVRGYTLHSPPQNV